MRPNTFAVLSVITAFGITLTGCGEHGPMSPTSPSLMSSRTPQDTQRSGTRLAPRGIDNDGDGYEDPDPGMPTDPPTAPMPNPEQIPLPEGIPAPVQLTISVVGLFGPLSFAPNPQHAAIGNTIVWMNNDVLPHDIVLDDGTPVGNLAPGQSSVPIALTTETASYHCTIHPSMTGQITPLPIEGVPPDASQAPMPDPSGSPPPDPYGDGYDDGYEDDYY
jgi:predicted small lipoprotein YifL